MTPTARTLKRLRDLGVLAQVVERWIPQARKRVDLFGCIDIVALSVTQGNTIGSKGVCGFQVCAGASHAARRAKVLATPAAKTWVECGNRLLVESWSKTGAKGRRKLWTVRIEEITLAMFTEAAA